MHFDWRSAVHHEVVGHASGLRLLPVLDGLVTETTDAASVELDRWPTQAFVWLESVVRELGRGVRLLARAFLLSILIQSPHVLPFPSHSGESCSTPNLRELGTIPD